MKRLYWVAVGLGVSFASPGAGQEPVPASPPGQQPAGQQPAPWANKFFLPDIAKNRDQAAPPMIVHDFGDVPHGTLCTHTFRVTNIYDVPMQIIEVRRSCTCLDFVPLSKVLQPNEVGEFTVTMNSAKFVGQNTQTFYVTFGPKFVSAAVIRVSANSRTEVTLAPGAVAFGTVLQGAKPVQSVKLEYKGRAAGWKVTEVVAPQGPIEVQVTETGRGGPIRGGAEYAVTVGLKPSAPPGPITEQVTLKTNDPNNPLIQVTVTGAVAAPIELAPNKVRIDDIQVGQSASQRVLIRAAKPFRVTGVDGAGAGVTVELPAARDPLPVQVITVKFDPVNPGPVSRDLRIKTDLDGGTGVTLVVEAEGVK
ncbi:MAG: hypothetical protein JWO38_686 [Gemmataceae bacterium]|nr:hypothetical protein [Gemmataceae bacterium]